jgi:hypothetical protein
MECGDGCRKGLIIFFLWMRTFEYKVQVSNAFSVDGKIIQTLSRSNIFKLARPKYWPPLWSSGQSSWLQIRRPGLDSRHYQKKKSSGMEWGPLSLVSTTEELLDRKVSAPVYKTENTAVGIRHPDHVAPSIRKSWQSLRRQAAVARSV